MIEGVARCNFSSRYSGLPFLSIKAFTVTFDSNLHSEMESILPASLVPMMTLTVVALGLWYHGSQSKFPRVGNTKLLTWIPTLSPMRYSLDVWAQRGYLEVSFFQSFFSYFGEKSSTKSILQFNKYLKPFVLKFFGYDYIILPPRYLEDLKRAKSEALSFNISFSEVSLKFERIL